MYSFKEAGCELMTVGSVQIVDGNSLSGLPQVPAIAPEVESLRMIQFVEAERFQVDRVSFHGASFPKFQIWVEIENACEQ